MFDPQKLTYKSQETIAAAAQLASTKSHPALDPWHLLFALLTSDGPAKEIVQKHADNFQQLVDQVDSKVSGLPTVSDNSEPRISAALGEILKKSADIASSHSEEYISQDALLLALINKDADSKDLLASRGVDINTLKQEVTQMKQGTKADSPSSDTTYNVLEKYTYNLTKQAREGKLDPVIGRDSEIRRVMQVLSRRTKNNPVLIGDPGVGKTAIVEGLAQRIVAGDVPDSLKSKDLLVLDIASILAGAKFRGEFEERLKAVLKQITSDRAKFVIFIDELHTIVGAGGAEGAVDASNMLKPGLARGELNIIGATTINEYRQHIEKDAALERRFQPIMVNEPSLQDTIAILRGLKEKYEVHHGIGITDEAVIAAATLSDRYITDRFLPDKAIDLLDEATSGLKIESESKPESLDKLDRRITQLQIESQALKGDKSPGAKDRKKDLDKQVADLKEDASKLEKRWQHQKQILEKISSIRGELDNLRIKLEEAQRDVKLEEAAKIQYGQIPSKQAELKKLEQQWDQIKGEDKLISQQVTAEDIAAVVARWTGVPVTKLLRSQAEKLASLEEELGKRVIGQKEALEAVSNAIRRARAGLSEEGKPTATFLFLGPTGVGKTETAKALAEFLFNDERALIRIDLSEYSERHSTARLIGAPPGYVGYDQGGQLTEAVRRRPYSVILLDEVEKAHDEIFNLFLQIFDDGRLTDGQGRTVDFRNSIIIMTSNLGSQLISKGDLETKTTQNQVWDLLRSKFAPEFLNRIDQIIIFEKLNKEEVRRIVDLQLQQLANQLAKQDFKLDVSDDAKALLANQGYDDEFGARPLKRLIQNQLVNQIASLLTKQELKPGTTLKVSTKASAFSVTPN